MRRRMTRAGKSTLIRILVVLIIVIAIAVGGLFFVRKNRLIESRYENTITELQSRISAVDRVIYCAAADLKAGTVLNEGCLVETAVMSDRTDYISSADFGKMLLVDVGEGMEITRAMIAEVVRDTGVRELEYDWIEITSNIEPMDYVDVRILYPDGTDYIVLSKKQVRNLSDTKLICDLWNTEEELLLLDSACVDAYLYAGSRIYIADIPGKKELLAQYVPVIAITDTDGFWIAYYDVIDKGSEKELVRRWTSKFYYFYLDNSVTKGKKATGFLYRFLGENSCICCDLNGIAGEKGRAYRIRCEDFFRTEGDFYESTDFRLTKKKNYDALILHREEFEEKRHEIMAAKLEEALSYYCGHYNRIAEDYGIEYSFSIPSADEKMYLRAAEGVSFMALFQGYPIKGTDEVVNRFALSNTEIVEASLYVVDKEGVYHRENCENVSTITAYYNSRRECAENGAKPCECCK